MLTLELGTRGEKISQLISSGTSVPHSLAFLSVCFPCSSRWIEWYPSGCGYSLQQMCVNPLGLCSPGGKMDLDLTDRVWANHNDKGKLKQPPGWSLWGYSVCCPCRIHCMYKQNCLFCQCSQSLEWILPFKCSPVWRGDPYLLLRLL